MSVEVVRSATGAAGTTVPSLPLTAFVDMPGRRDRFGVMVVAEAGPGAVAKLREVELGDVVGSRVAVTRGLAAGDRVITAAASKLADGERVEIVSADAP